MATLHELEALECDGRLKPHFHDANGWSSISTSSDPTYCNGARPASNALPIFWQRMFGTNFNRKSTNHDTNSGRWACETRLPSSDTIFFAAFPSFHEAMEWLPLRNGLMTTRRQGGTVPQQWRLDNGFVTVIRIGILVYQLARIETLFSLTSSHTLRAVPPSCCPSLLKPLLTRLCFAP